MRAIAGLMTLAGAVTTTTAAAQAMSPARYIEAAGAADVVAPRSRARMGSTGR